MYNGLKVFVMVFVLLGLSFVSAVEDSNYSFYDPLTDTFYSVQPIQVNKTLFNDNMFLWWKERILEWIRGNQTATIINQGGGIALNGNQFNLVDDHYELVGYDNIDNHTASQNYSHLSNFTDDLGHTEDNDSWNQTRATELYADISVVTDNVTWSESYANSLYCQLVGCTMTGDLIFNDNVNAMFGIDSNASIDWDGTNLVIDPDLGGSGIVDINGALDVLAPANVNIQLKGSAGTGDITINSRDLLTLTGRQDVILQTQASDGTLQIKSRNIVIGSAQADTMVFQPRAGGTVEFKDALSNNIMWFQTTPIRMGFGTVTPTARVEIVGNEDVVQHLIIGHSTQTANYLTINSSNNVSQFYVTGGGNVVIPADNKMFKWGASEDDARFFNSTGSFDELQVGSVPRYWRGYSGYDFDNQVNVTSLNASGNITASQNIYLNQTLQLEAHALATCDGTTNGTIARNTTKIYFCDGSIWNALY